MQEIFQWFVSLLSMYIQYLVLGAFAVVIFDKKIIWKRLLLFVLVNVLANDLPRFVLPQNITMLYIIIYFITMLVSLKYILCFDLLSTLLSTCIIFLLSSGVHYISMAILKISLKGFDLYAWLGASFLNLMIARNLGTALDLLAVFIVYFLKIKINIRNDLNKKRIFTITINIFIAVVLVVPNILFFETATFKIPTDLIMFNAASVLALLLLSIYNSIKQGELDVRSQEVEFQKIYINTLVNLIDSLRGFKHDFNNIIEAMGGYLSLDDIDGLKSYYSQIQNEARKINSIAPVNSYVKDNPPVYGLLLSKLSYCEINDIEFDIKVLTKIDIGNFKTLDFCKILGVLLDNALEAALKSEKKYAQVHIRESMNTKGLVIELNNSFSGTVDINEIFKKGFTTKQEHSGFGLWEVKKILSKYENCYLETDMRNDYFTQLLTIRSN